MNVAALLDKIKETRSIAMDKDLATLLHVDKGTVSNWRKGHRLPDAIACDRIAQLSGVPLARVLGIVGEARALSREEKSVWRKLANVAAVAVVLVIATLFPKPAHAMTSHNVYYVKDA